MSWGSAWGLSWGDSWGWSWGPLHEVEEHPEQYYGNGRRISEKESKDSVSDDDLIRLVADKWETIERVRAEDARNRLLAAKHVAEKSRISEYPSPPNALAAAIDTPAIPFIEKPSLVRVIPGDDALLTERNTNDEAIIALLLAA